MLLLVLFVGCWSLKGRFPWLLFVPNRLQCPIRSVGLEVVVLGVVVVVVVVG